MLIISDIGEYKSSSPLSIAIGRFDGVHLGHRAVIEAAVKYRAERPLLPAVLTFEQSPHGVLTGEMVYALTTGEKKRELIESLGVKEYFCPRFDSVKDMLPEEFVYMLKTALGVCHISCGYNFTFGKGGTGNPALLKSLCKQYDIALTVVPPVDVGGAPVSSSEIRRRIADGDMLGAAEMLGYEFFVELPVIGGNHLGSKLGFPTINQKLPPTLIHPKFGVYATVTEIDGRRYRSVTNIGTNPTVGGDYPRVETHILGFDGDLYGQTIKVNFNDFLRDEQAFSSIDELKNAVENDIKAVQEII